MVGSSPMPHFLRKVDPQKDLGFVADLIELCFADTLDWDGRDYLSYLRRLANEAKMFAWVPGAFDKVTSPLSGFVWEEEGKIIGNLSLIPAYRNGGWRYLIANVAVHPDYRRRGIARHLTRQGIEHARSQGAASVWLQVRSDNPGAYALYLALGMVEFARRTTWVFDNRDRTVLQNRQDLVITPRRRGDWEQQVEWLKQIYPHRVSGYLPFNSAHLKPGLWQSLVNLMKEQQINQWSVRKGQNLIGVVSWEASHERTDHLWMAIHPECCDDDLSHLLRLVVSRLPDRGKPISVNFPAGRGESAFHAAGFRELNTLIWMEKSFR